MARTSTNLWLDVASLVVFVGLAATGAVLRFVLPPGSGSALTLVGLGRHDVGDVHLVLAVGAIVLLTLHVAIHWSWVCGAVGKTIGRPAPSARAQTAWGLTLLLGIGVLLGGGMLWASAAVEQGGAGGGRRGGTHLEAPREGGVPEGSRRGGRAGGGARRGSR